MYKILFVCHGNICRSPTAEFVMKDLVRRAGLEGEYEISSAAAHTDALGEGVYGPSRRMLAAHGIDCSGKRARLMLREDYKKYDLLIGMDRANLRDMELISMGDPEKKIKNLLSYAGRPDAAVADPWYTRDFEATWRDVNAGCQGLLEALSGVICIDFSKCRSREELFAVIREKSCWQSWYGNNLDALYDVLTGLSHKGRRFLILPPEDSAPEDVKSYAGKIAGVFAEAAEEMQ